MEIREERVTRMNEWLNKQLNKRGKIMSAFGDIFPIINKKFKDWWGTNMQSYLRPETLFNETKFQSYINEIGDSKNWSNIV